METFETPRRPSLGETFPRGLRLRHLLAVLILYTSSHALAGWILEWGGLHRGLAGEVLPALAAGGLSFGYLMRVLPVGLPERGVGRGLLAGLVLAVLNISAARLAYPYPHTGTLADRITQSTSTVDMVLAGLLVVLVAPAFEEAFFRGLVYGFLKHVAGVGYAVALSSLAFASLHSFQGGTFMVLLLLGCLCVYLLETSDSLLPPILAHAGLNLGFLAAASRRGQLLDSIREGTMAALTLATLLLFLWLAPRLSPRRGGPGRASQVALDRLLYGAGITALLTVSLLFVHRALLQGQYP